jgi:hypothetical protein
MPKNKIDVNKTGELNADATLRDNIEQETLKQ